MLHEMIWRVSDQAALQRELERASIRAGAPKESAKVWFDYLMREMQAHPLEWPTSTRPPSEHTCRVGTVFVDYRLIPDSQTIEVISVRGRHTHSDSP